MPSTYSTNLRLELPATGEKSGTWGTITNTNLGTLLEEAIGGYISIAMTDANYTLSALNATADEARNASLRFTGSLSTTRNVVCPTIEKIYLVWNATSGGQSIVFKTAAGTGVTVLNGNKALVFADGTNVVEVIQVTVPVAQGGTGATTASAARTNLAVPGLADANTFTNTQIISVNTAGDALRITQTGAGNALVVEDSANPDFTPFLVRSDGSVFVGSQGGDFSRDTWVGAFRRDQNSDTEFGLINNTTGNAASITLSRITGTAFGFCTWSFFDNSGAPYDEFSYGGPVTHVKWSWAGDEKFRFAKTGAMGFGGANYGTSGQVLMSGGSAASPAWTSLGISNVTGLQTALDGKQPLDAELTALAGLSTTADNFIVANGTTWTVETPAQVRTTLGLVIGTNVQAYDETLQSLSALGTAADRIAYTTGVNTWAEANITAAGRALIDDADAAAQRTTLGLGSLATLNAVGTAQITDGNVTASKIAVNSVDGTKIALGSDAQGDIMYYNGTDWARLAAGTTGQVLKTNGSGANPEWSSGLVRATAIASTSGTSVDFTGIPSWARRITIMLSGVSTNSNSPLQVQLGDAGGIETTGYSGTTMTVSSGGQSIATNTSGISLSLGADSSTTTRNGNIVLVNLSGNTWVVDGGISSPELTRQCFVAYSKTLSDVLTQVRVTTLNGSDTFDAGTINIMYE